ncbi:MAG: hypothetical protein H7839_22865 [Magnetococcus sp. YQC-5]
MQKNGYMIFLTLFMILVTTQPARSEVLFTTGAMATIAGLAGLTGYYTGQNTSTYQVCYPQASQVQPVCQATRARPVYPSTMEHNSQGEPRYNFERSGPDTFEVYR